MSLILLKLYLEPANRLPYLSKPMRFIRTHFCPLSSLGRRDRCGQKERQRDCVALNANRAL